MRRNRTTCGLHGIENCSCRCCYAILRRFMKISVQRYGHHPSTFSSYFSPYAFSFFFSCCWSSSAFSVSFFFLLLSMVWYRTTLGLVCRLFATTMMLIARGRFRWCHLHFRLLSHYPSACYRTAKVWLLALIVTPPHSQNTIARCHGSSKSHGGSGE